MRAKRATFTFWVDKSWLKMPKMIYWKPEAFDQKVLPDKSLLIEQKLMENAKIENLNWESHYETFWVIFKHDATYVIETISMTLQRLSGNLRHF